MSINRNFTRTLSGANSFTIDNLELSSHKNTIRINGNSGNVGDVIGKDANNKLVFQTLAPFVIDPDSIDGTKLTNNISITTTGNYNGNSMTLTGDLQVNNDVTIDGNLTYAGDLNIDDLIVDSLTLDENFVGNGNINLNQHKIVGDYVNLDINGNTGSIICFQLTTKDSVLIEDTLSVVGNIDTSGNIELTTGNIDLTAGNIELIAGNIIAPAGTVECLDLETTGEITGGDDITIVGNYNSTDGNITLTNGNISCIDLTATNGFFDDITLPKTGTAVISLNGTNGNINTDGNFTTTSGNIHTSSGNIFTATGDIHANGGYVRGDELRFLSQLQLGNSASPSFYIDSSGNIVTGSGSITCSHTGSYASNDFALELTEANSHAKIGGNLKVDGTIFGTIVGDVSETHINGQSLRIHDLGDEGGNTGIQVEDGYDISMYSDAGTTKVFSIDGATGDVNSKNGGITLTNGDINLTNGTLFGNVVGTITEEIIDAQIINLRDGTPSSGAFIGMEINDTATKYGEISMRDSSNNYNFRVYSGGNVDIAGAIVWNGATFNNVNGGDILMNDGKIRSTNTSTSKLDLDFDTPSIIMRDGVSANNLMSISNQFITIRNPTYPTITGTSISDTFYRLNDSSNNSGNARIIMESVNGISLLSGSNVYNLTLSPAGNLFWSNNSAGEVIGRDAGVGGSNDENTTNMRNIRVDESCFKYATREIAISKPTSRIERTFTATSTSWSAINDELYVNLKTNIRDVTNFTVEWSYYAVKDDGSRLWAKLFDINASSPEDVDQPSYLNNTKQVLFDGGSDKTGQHHGTFTMRNVTANIDKQIGVCVWTIVNTKSFINFYLGPASFSGDPPTGGSNSSYGFGGMTLQIKKLYDGGISNTTPTGWSGATSTDTLYIRNNPVNSPYFYHKTYDPTISDFDSLSTTYQALLYSNVAGTFVAETEEVIVELLTYNYTSTSNKWFYLRLVDTGGSEFSIGTNNGGSGTGTRLTERTIHYADETDKQPVMISWKLEGLTIGNTYNLAPQVKTNGIYNYAVAGGGYPPTILRAYKLENEEPADDY